MNTHLSTRISRDSIVALSCVIAPVCLWFALFRSPVAYSDTLPVAPSTGPGGIAIPQDFRNWRLASVAHEEGNLHSFAAVLGNEVAIAAFRDQKIPFPDGTIIASLHYRHVPSAENNEAFGGEQSFVPGDPTNVQFMIKDSKQYGATGGWGFLHIPHDGKPASDALMSTCFPCHRKAKSGDMVFTRYAP